jgi:hypothetical protein
MVCVMKKAPAWFADLPADLTGGPCPHVSAPKMPTCLRKERGTLDGLPSFLVWTEHAEAAGMSNGKPVDQPSRETVKVRQGTGPRATVSVLLVSLSLAAIAALVLLAYVYMGPTPAPSG